MPDFSTFSSPGAYHVLSYGTLLGSQFFQTFIAGPVAFRVLPRPSFATLQSGIFPVYFTMQTAIPAILALTFPGMAASTVAGGRVPGGIGGVIDERARFSTLLPLATVCLTSMANLVWLGPLTTKIMKERKHQETRDSKKYYDSGPHSAEMQRLNKRFGMLHGISSLVNMVGFVATVLYGGTIADIMR